VWYEIIITIIAVLLLFYALEIKRRMIAVTIIANGVLTKTKKGVVSSKKPGRPRTVRK